MTRTAARKRWQLWFACLAILLNVLTPSLSYAMAALHANASASANAAAIEICSSSGTLYTQAELSPAAKSGMEPVLHHVQHCPFCMSHAGNFALPLQQPLPFALSGGHASYPALFYQAPPALFVWTDSRPRGPPQPA